MLIVDLPWLPGSWPAVLAVTLLFNKLYLPYILLCVWKFFSNPCLDHDTSCSSTTTNRLTFQCFYTHSMHMSIRQTLIGSYSSCTHSDQISCTQKAKIT